MLLRVRSDLAGIVWPPISVGAKATLGQYLWQLERSQWLPAGEIAALQHAQLVALATHAATHCEPFRARLEEAALKPEDLATPEGLRRLPVLGRRALQAAGARLYCAEVPEGHLPLTESRTSGSTGEPVVVRRTQVNRLDWMAMTVRDHFWHGRDVTKPISVIRARNGALRERPDWGLPMSLLFDTGPAQYIPITLDVARQVELLRRFGPEHLLLYPSILDAIARYCRTNDLTLNTVKHVWTMAESLTPAIREDAEETFGVKIEDTYSSEEVGVIAIQCPASGLYHAMEHIIVEVRDAEGRPCADGEVGRMVVTDLHNWSMPIIRYDIGDYAEMAGECPCGRGLPALRRIVGRERNLIVMPDGGRKWPLVSSSRFRRIAPIQQYQLIQHTREAIEVRLVAEATITADQENRLRALIQDSLGHAFDLSFTYFDDEIPRAPGDKFEEFVCKIAT